MKIGLIDVDGHHFPNLALMKLSVYHKEKGDIVEWVNYWDKYNRVYCSKVFTFTPDVLTRIQADEVIKGGTGYNLHDELFCDSVLPDYSMYSMYAEACGFLTRGCILKCPWCVVLYREGAIRPYCGIAGTQADNSARQQRSCKQFWFGTDGENRAVEMSRGFQSGIGRAAGTPAKFSAHPTKNEWLLKKNK